MPSIYDFVKEQRDDYRSETVTITDGYEHSQYETLRTIELYHNSRFLSGNKDRHLSGQMLTLIDASIADPEQRKGMKDIARKFFGAAIDATFRDALAFAEHKSRK